MVSQGSSCLPNINKSTFREAKDAIQRKQLMNVREISKKGVRLGRSKIDAIVQMRVPQNVKQKSTFLNY